MKHVARHLEKHWRTRRCERADVRLRTGAWRRGLRGLRGGSAVGQLSRGSGGAAVEEIEQELHDVREGRYVGRVVFGRRQVRMTRQRRLLITRRLAGVGSLRDGRCWISWMSRSAYLYVQRSVDRTCQGWVRVGINFSSKKQQLVFVSGQYGLVGADAVRSFQTRMRVARRTRKKPMIVYGTAPSLHERKPCQTHKRAVPSRHNHAVTHMWVLYCTFTWTSKCDLLLPTVCEDIILRPALTRDGTEHRYGTRASRHDERGNVCRGLNGLSTQGDGCRG